MGEPVDTLYLVVAGLSVGSLLKGDHVIWVASALLVFAGLILVAGIANYFVQNRAIKASRIHIGNYRLDYLDKDPV